MRRPSRTDERPTLKDAVSSRSVGSVSPGRKRVPISASNCSAMSS